MDELTEVEWRLKAMTVLYRVTAAERRFSASLRLNEVTILAAADELEAATRDALAWISSNQCPDARLGAHISGMLGTCAEVAATAEHAIAENPGDTAAVLGRLGDLMRVIDIDWEACDPW